MRYVRKSLAWGALGLAGLAVGAAIAFFISSHAGKSSGQGPHSWRSLANAGSTQAGLFERAHIALVGIWALPATEVVYFIAESDVDGRPLSRGCDYEITGVGDAPARWWSINLYRDYFWVDNPADRYSFSKTTVTRAGDGRWRILVSAKPQVGDWLPMGAKDGRFTLSYRLYQPEPSVTASLAAVPLPPVRRLKCA